MRIYSVILESTIFLRETPPKNHLGFKAFFFLYSADASKNRTTCVHRASPLRVCVGQGTREAGLLCAFVRGFIRMQDATSPRASRRSWPRLAPWPRAMSAPHTVAGLAASPSQWQGTSNEPPGASRRLPCLSEGLAPASERSVAVTLTFGPRLGCFGHEMYVFFQRSNQCLRNWGTYETRILKTDCSFKTTECRGGGLQWPPP